MSEYQGTFKRYEKKYLVTQQQYNALAKAFAARMVPDRFAESTISNIYYDTPDFRLIRRSLDRPAYKEKLRLRTYRTPGADTEAFVEIKKKYDHIVYKRRVAMTYSEAQSYLDGGAAPEQSQISREIDWFLHFYKGPGTTPLWLARVLSENAIFPTHFSKYGAAYQTMLREDRSPQFGSETIHINEKGEIYCA